MPRSSLGAESAVSVRLVGVPMVVILVFRPPVTVPCRPHFDLHDRVFHGGVAIWSDGFEGERPWVMECHAIILSGIS